MTEADQVFLLERWRELEAVRRYNQRLLDILQFVETDVSFSLANLQFLPEKTERINERLESLRSKLYDLSRGIDRWGTALRRIETTEAHK